MKLTIYIVTIFCIFALTAAQKYTNRFDNVDVDSILGNQRILGNYIKCVLDKGACTAEGRELKRLLPDALATDCSKCTDTQRRNSNKVIGYLRQNKPADFKQILKKYDPQGKSQAARSF